jgi:hypothetical protein
MLESKKTRNFMNYLIERLREPSTIIALLSVGSAFFGLDLTPDQQAAVTMLAGAIFVSKG